MSSTKTLTGRTRYRIQTRWFRKPLLVLQVEVHTEGVTYDHSNPYDYDGRPYVHDAYRDATVEDLQLLNEMSEFEPDKKENPDAE